MCFVFKLELYPWEIGGVESLSGFVSKKDYNSNQTGTQKHKKYLGLYQRADTGKR